MDSMDSNEAKQMKILRFFLNAICTITQQKRIILLPKTIRRKNGIENDSLFCQFCFFDWYSANIWQTNDFRFTLSRLWNNCFEIELIYMQNSQTLYVFCVHLCLMMFNCLSLSRFTFQISHINLHLNLSY